jgi:hypothetical protein
VVSQVATLLVLIFIASIDSILYAVELQVLGCDGQLDSEVGSKGGKDGGQDC